MMRRLSVTLGLVLLAACGSPTAHEPSVVLEVTASNVIAKLVTTSPHYFIQIPYRVENQSGVALHVAECGSLHVEKLTPGGWQRFWPLGSVVCTLQLSPPLEPGGVRTGIMTVVLDAGQTPAAHVAGAFRLVTGFSAPSDVSRKGEIASNAFEITPEQ